jgi:carboxymethylenebutenolidase
MLASGIEVTIPAGADFAATPAFAILPPGAKKGVVVIHEAFGRQPEIDRVVQRFAQRGYAAIEPDLFRAPSRFNCIRRFIDAVRSGGHGSVVHQAAAIRTWLCENAKIEPRHVGIIGFCFGGGFALAVGRGWGAVSTNYGYVPPNAEALRGMGPTIGCYGGRDRLFATTGSVLEKHLRAVGTEVETHTFQDVGHSFLTDGHHPIAAALTRPVMHIDYKPETAEEGWRRIMAFFDKHLE